MFCCAYCKGDLCSIGCTCYSTTRIVGSIGEVASAAHIYLAVYHYDGMSIVYIVTIGAGCVSCDIVDSGYWWSGVSSIACCACFGIICPIVDSAVDYMCCVICGCLKCAFHVCIWAWPGIGTFITEVIFCCGCTVFRAEELKRIIGRVIYPIRCYCDILSAFDGI